MADTIFASTWDFGATACKQAWHHWEESKDLVAAVEAGAIAVERDLSVSSVGVGGLPNTAGEIELDAGIMVGADLDYGAVAAVKDISPAISLAIEVMRHSKHVLLVGEGARDFAISRGFKPTELMTEQTRHRYEHWCDETRRGIARDAEADSHDTVGVIGWHKGHGVVACSTSGYAWKLPGRVGDSPIVGSGLYADDEVGVVVATGLGEDILRFSGCFAVIERMRKGMTAQKACEDMIAYMRRRQPRVAERQNAFVAVRRDGLYGAAGTQSGFTAQFMVDGQLTSKPC